MLSRFTRYLASTCVMQRSSTQLFENDKPRPDTPMPTPSERMHVAVLFPTFAPALGAPLEPSNVWLRLDDAPLLVCAFEFVLCAVAVVASIRAATVARIFMVVSLQGIGFAWARDCAHRFCLDQVTGSSERYHSACHCRSCRPRRHPRSRRQPSHRRRILCRRVHLQRLIHP